MLQASENKREAKVKDLIKKKTCGIFGQIYWVSGLLFVHSVWQCILLLIHKPSRDIFVIILCSGPSSSYSKFYSLKGILT
jgi:hypothetical protein